MSRTILMPVKYARKGSVNVPSAGYLQKLQKFELLDCGSFDHLGPFHETPSGHKNSIVAIENISRYVVVRPVRPISAKETADMLIQEIILRFGPPKYLTSDRGSAYTSTIFTETYKIMVVQQRFTTAYHPQANALAERMMRYIAEKLTAYIDKSETMVRNYSLHDLRVQYS